MSGRPHTELSELPPRERALRYRELAREQRRLADGSDIPDIRRTHLELGAMWSRLASQAERQVAEAPPAEDDLSPGSPRA